ncbi:MAG: ATP-dependent DNA helicase [bacterium]|nr:ATP-dependent DNA helicase [bacterium]
MSTSAGRGAGDAPWDELALDPGLAFCTLRTSGDDPELDQLMSVHALRARSDEAGSDHSGVEGGFEGGFEGLDQPCEGELEVQAAWSAFAAFVKGRPIVVAETQAFRRWWLRFEGAGSTPPVCVATSEVRALLAPGRTANKLASDALPHELQAELESIARAFTDEPPSVRRVAATGYASAWHGLCAVDARAAAGIALALTLVEHPTRWSASLGSAREGALSLAVSLAEDDEPLLDGLSPYCADAFTVWAEHNSVPPQTDPAKPFLPEDLSVLDRVFDEHLPAAFAAETGTEARHREGQHAVAREVARTLGADELLLVHAPTGTGKTIAYLVPALLWARRHDVRVGIATYTRALQEQAMEREVPRTLAAFRAAGLADGFRVSVLKGRENYLCWRALRLVAPGAEDDAETWLAWTALALFALTDPSGDLDRLGSAPPIVLTSSAPYRRTLGPLMRSVRAQTSCCVIKDDRATCAAEVARRRAERSHVVITNHAFALARQEFFRHVIFDECEHLHDQAHNAWSHHLPLRSLRDLFARVHKPDKRASRAPLDRIARQLIDGTPSQATLEACRAAWRRACSALADLRAELEAFERWRRDERRGRGTRDDHSLLRDYVESEHGAGLLGVRRELVAAGSGLDAGLAEVTETLDRLPLRGAPRIRRSLDVARGDLSEALGALDAWIPTNEGKPAFRRETFYDVDFDPRGEPLLAARVLLPNEFLGRYYYPALANAVFLSATTRLQGDFASASGYLGLDRTADPDEEEERVGRVVRNFCVPEVFDYERVLVGVPRDAPSARDKGPFLRYVAEFLAFLTERTRGRTLVLFTNLEDVRTVGGALTPKMREQGLPLWYQGMEGIGKEELSELFRRRTDSILLGVDTFWYGADFPGETLEYLVIVRLPYGVPDRYHHAQGAALGESDQRRRIYMPRALAKLRQGFGRLMRRESDRGCVFVLDNRILDPRHRTFLRELPVRTPGREDEEDERLARFVRGDTDHVLNVAFEHMDLAREGDVERRELLQPFRAKPEGPRGTAPSPQAGSRTKRTAPEPLDIPKEDLPF